MKSRLSKVLGKMPKENIELAKVELGVVQDAQKANAQGNKIVEQAQKHFTKIDSLYMQYVTIVNKNKAIIKELNDNLSFTDKIKKNVEKASKELGVNPKEISEYIELNDTLDNLKNIKTRLRNYPSIK